MKRKYFLVSTCLLAALVALSGCGESATSELSGPVAEVAEAEPSAQPAGDDDFVAPDIDLPQLEPIKAGDPIAVITTDMGEIKIRLFPKYAPKAVENFTTHAKDGYYDGVIFHRVIKDFMLQTGDPKGDGTGGESIWGAPFEDEFSPSLHNIRGAVSMANAGANTNGSQFFIIQNNGLSDGEMQAFEEAKKDMNQIIGQDSNGVTVRLSEMYPEKILDEYMKSGGSQHLDYVHTVFGQVYEGMDVVDAIAATEVEGTANSPKPVKDIHIVKIEVGEYK